MGPLLLLELAAVVACRTLRARHVQLEGDVFPGEAEEVSVARGLVADCATLRTTLRRYRRLVVVRLVRERQS
jgi:hypothetical protein